MKQVIVTGSQGFIGSYITQALIRAGYYVYGIDNFSKYGRVARPHDENVNFKLIEWDLTKSFPDNKELKSASFIVACAAMIGGIAYFHKYAYDLMATNERILANTFDFAIQLRKYNQLEKILALSSSMVFENTTIYPTPETEINRCPPPISTYGFQKLAVEYFCKGAWEQYGLPYTIIRPFNCVGVGEDKALSEEKVSSGNIQMMMSHVVPDLIFKAKSGQYPLRILGEGNQIRCYTNGSDIARAIVLALEHPNALNEDFNISSTEAISVLDLAKLIWQKLRKEPFAFETDAPFKNDVQKRIPSTEKAERLLGFRAIISLEQSLTEVIEYMHRK